MRILLVEDDVMLGDGMVDALRSSGYEGSITLLGDEADYLIDDRPHKANCLKFKGTLLVYEGGRQEWPELLQIFRNIKAQAARPWAIGAD